MSILSRCCCCCQLRTGAVLLASMGLIFEVLDLAAVAAVYDNRYIIAGDGSSEFLGNRLEALRGLSTGLPIYIACIIIKMLCYICMSYGAIKGNRYLLLPWLFLELVTMVFLGLLVLVSGIILTFIAPLACLIMVFGFPFIGLELYLWLCVLSCFQDLRDSSQTEGTQPLLQYPPRVEQFLGYSQGPSEAQPQVNTPFHPPSHPSHPSHTSQPSRPSHPSDLSHSLHGR